VKEVVGLDLSLTSTGVCDALGNARSYGGDAKVGDKRLTLIGNVLRGMIDISPPDLVVIEDLPRGAMGGTSSGMVHGIARYLLLESKTPYALVVPSVLKVYATGKGTASKVAMALAAYKRAEVEFLNDDECDAWWLRAMGLDALGEPLFELPASHRKALTKVSWPVLK